ERAPASYLNRTPRTSAASRLETPPVKFGICPAAGAPVAARPDCAPSGAVTTITVAMVAIAKRQAAVRARFDIVSRGDSNAVDPARSGAPPASTTSIRYAI